MSVRESVREGPSGGLNLDSIPPRPPSGVGGGLDSLPPPPPSGGLGRGDEIPHIEGGRSEERGVPGQVTKES